MADLQAIIRAVFGVSTRRAKGHLPILAKAPREALGEVYKQAGFRSVAEIGVKKGQYAEAICAINPTIAYLCVDMWDREPDKYLTRRSRFLRQARQRLAPYPVTFVVDYSLNAAKNVPDQSLDAVYIDAAHDFDNVVQDLIQWSAKVKPGGIVAGHDFYHHCYGGVVPAVNAYALTHRIDPWYVTYELMPSFFWVKP